MADGLNRVMAIGNLGVDPELRMTQSGQALLKLRIACTESYLDRNRVRQERTEWMSVTIWGRRAEALNKILSKGTRIFVEGKLQTSSYDDRDGNKRYRTEVVATNIILCGGRSSGSSGGGSSGGSGRDRDFRNPDALVDVGGGDSGGHDNGGSYPDADYGGGDDNIPF